MSGLNNLFSPLELGSLRLPNRITMAPMYLGYADDQGRPTEIMIEHYREMGASGAGLVVCENAAIDPLGMGSPWTLRIDDDRYIEGLARLAGSIKEGGALAGLQINHAGRFAFGREVVAPSAVAVGKKTPHALEGGELEGLIESFAQAADRARRAGFDLVELHGGTGYLLAQFISPRTNIRRDSFGGTKENRLRLPLAVIERVRRAVGRDFPIGYRFVADEWLEDGLSLPQGLEVASKLAEAGLAYLSVVGGTYESFFLPQRREQDQQPGYMADLAAEVKKVVSIPVITAGRIQQPSLAEDILAQGGADLIGLARVLLADPKWPIKALNDQEITVCEPTCRLCWNRVSKGKPVVCSQWTKDKRERIDPEIGPDA